MNYKVSQKKTKEKRKKESGWCEKCYFQICPCVIEQIRKMEDAMFAAKQSIESLDAMLHKKTLEKDNLMKVNKELKAKLEGKRQADISNKMKEIDRQVSRFQLRNKIAVN